jgi:hypothetical protein
VNPHLQIKTMKAAFPEAGAFDESGDSKLRNYFIVLVAAVQLPFLYYLAYDSHLFPSSS